MENIVVGAWHYISPASNRRGFLRYLLPLVTSGVRGSKFLYMDNLVVGARGFAYLHSLELNANLRVSTGLDTSSAVR